LDAAADFVGKVFDGHEYENDKLVNHGFILLFPMLMECCVCGTGAPAAARRVSGMEVSPQETATLGAARQRTIIWTMKKRRRCPGFDTIVHSLCGLYGPNVYSCHWLKVVAYLENLEGLYLYLLMCWDVPQTGSLRNHQIVCTSNANPGFRV